VAGFSNVKMTVQNTTNHHNPTTNSPARNHVETPDFAKNPSKNAKSPAGK
jgi:hypothetical protein